MGITKSKHKPLAQDKAIYELKSQRDQITKYQLQLNAVINREIEIVHQCLSKGDKRKALLALRKKKYQEQLIKRSEQQLLLLEEMTLSIEYAIIESQVVEGLEKGNETLKEIHQQCSIEKVEQIMSDTADAIQYQKEIESELYDQLNETDESSVMKELEIIILGQLPSVPTSNPILSPSTTTTTTTSNNNNNNNNNNNKEKVLLFN